jgi:hypothetical protein
MFGNKRKKAANFVIGRLRPLLGHLQMSRGMPQGFWQDEFVLGFFHFTIGFQAAQSGIRLTQIDRGMILPEIYSALSNINGHKIARHATDLAMEYPMPHDFKLGVDYAEICALATVGKGVEHGRQFIETAKTAAAAQGQSRDTGLVAAHLYSMLFYDEIGARFD